MVAHSKPEEWLILIGQVAQKGQDYSFEYITWIFTNAPNLGKMGCVSEIKDFLPCCTALPGIAFIPQPGNTSPEKCAWEKN